MLLCVLLSAEGLALLLLCVLLSAEGLALLLLCFVVVMCVAVS